MHLLKQRSKAVPQERKRRKIDLYARPALFLQEFEEHKREETEAQAAMANARPPHASAQVARPTRVRAARDKASMSAQLIPMRRSRMCSSMASEA